MKLLLSAAPSERQFHPETARQFLEQGPALIVVPTATMADHYRHTLTRAGFPLRPQAIQTLAQFLDQHAPMAAAPIPLVHYLLSRAIERQKPYPFRSIAQDPGLLGGLTRLFAEASAQRLRNAGSNVAVVNAVASLFQEVETELGARQMAPRHARLEAAAQRIREGQSRTIANPALAHRALPRKILIDGFAKFSQGEVALLLALADQTSESDTLAVALPTWFGVGAAQAQLLAAGFAERAAPASSSGRGSVRVVAALNVEREVDEIARRILVHVKQGRAFREIGIILRAREPYGPLIETTLARFGIPSRSYFTDPAARHPAIQYLSSIMQALLSNWDLAPLLSGLRMPISGVGANEKGDEFDFALRERLPGFGLPSGDHYFSEQRMQLKPRDKRKPSGRSLTQDASLPQEALNKLAELSALRSERLEPAAWAERLQGLAFLIPAPTVEDHASFDQAQMWRSTSVALRALRESLESSAAAFSTPTYSTQPRCDLKTFWNQVATTLSLEPLRVPDLRRNVVHVLDAYEARQWELPVVFVCGMTERHFPQYHSENPIIGDEVLRRAGLDAAADHEREEQFLFEVATTRATVETVLSHPKFNDAGDPTLPSFFLQSVDTPVEDCRIQVRPSRGGDKPHGHENSAVVIGDAGLLNSLATIHKSLSASSIERYLQCPFMFYAEKTLRLRERPPAPRDRLNLLLQGTIIHRALAELPDRPLLGAAILDQVFDEECTRAHVPSGYRTEAVRLELRRHFQAFLENETMPGFASRQVELSFDAPLTDQLSIRGRIDRVDIDDQQRALVIDYKYSPAAKIRERIDDSADGSLVQAGLYMLAARDGLGLDPVGMLFCGVKKGVTWGGWSLTIDGVDVGTRCTPEYLDELMQKARGQALHVHEGALAGRIAPHPADKSKCSWCDLQDICRVDKTQASPLIDITVGELR